MTLVKCPRCELNYLRNNESICKICHRELYGNQPIEEVETCSTCNEAPALPGKDVCLYCLREMNKQKGVKEELEEPVEIGLDPVSGMEEMIPDIANEDDPDFHVMGDALSLEEMSEQEDNDSDDDEENDD
ncbi:MAG: hypothetical protein GX171_00880 [Clostridiales bacterium]|jgi:hypothetical protein|nr:hypothetical protein [Clostridiales bacterium]